MGFKKTGQKQPKAQTETKQQSPKVETTQKVPRDTQTNSGKTKEKK